MELESSISVPTGEVGKSHQLTEFFDGFMYDRRVFLVDRIIKANATAGEMICELDTTRPLLVSDYQLGNPELHPRHVSGADMVMMTVSLGSLHAFYFHGCRWKDGWVGFGSRMRDVHFKSLSTIGPPIQMRSTELRTRKGPKRVMMEMDFEFTQDGKVVYKSEQSAMFVRPNA